MSGSILVVDDEADVAELFRQQFRHEIRQRVYVMHFAQSGEAALTMLAEGIRPELVVILSDINMPGMDGLTLLGEIKRQWSNLRVMMVTAYGDDDRRRVAGEREQTRDDAEAADRRGREPRDPAGEQRIGRPHERRAERGHVAPGEPELKEFDLESFLAAAVLY